MIGQDVRRVAATGRPRDTHGGPSGDAITQAGRNAESTGALQSLWTQSMILRERALQLRAATMEARATARDLRLRRAGYGLKLVTAPGSTQRT